MKNQADGAAGNAARIKALTSLPSSVLAKGTMTASEFAQAIKRPYDTVREWLQRGWLPGAQPLCLGKRRVWQVPSGLVESLGSLRLPKAKPRPTPTQETEFGTEKYCARCEDFWPIDFFYRPLDPQCKACHLERRATSRPSLPIVRQRVGASTLVIVTYRAGRTYAALYPPGADTSEAVIRGDLMAKGFGHRRKNALFLPYNPVTGQFLPIRTRRSRRRLTRAPRPKPGPNHPWRLAENARIQLIRARAEGRRALARRRKAVSE